MIKKWAIVISIILQEGFMSGCMSATLENNFTYNVTESRLRSIFGYQESDLAMEIQ